MCTGIMKSFAQSVAGLALARIRKMANPTQLLARLDAIGRALAASQHALALISLGSVGTELERLDEFSDLDFFVIVAAGYKRHYLTHLNWLSDICPIAYQFQNTADGYKLLFADGIFCEFAIFELAELSGIPFAAGRIVWKQPQVEDAIRIPSRGQPASAPNSTEWLVGEALTNLYVGLCRERRGERLSAQRFIQHYAVDRIVELSDQLEAAQPAFRDGFANERRYEQRFPQLAHELPRFIPGYAANRESALAILGFLEQHFSVNPQLAQSIRALAQATTNSTAAPPSSHSTK